MKHLLQIKDLKTWFPIRRGAFSRTVGHVRAVDGVSLQIGQGESLGLVGESGCGKTTLARTILGLDPSHSGSVVFDGTELIGKTEGELRPLRQDLQVIFQDPFASLNPRMTVSGIVTEGMVQHGFTSPREGDAAATKLLEEVGMNEDALHRYPHEFSGGQRQRICVARAISLRPKLVICDEAVSALDVSVQAQVINLLMDLREKHGLAYLFISHDLSVVRHISDNIAVMYLGRIVEYGASREVIDRPHHPYTQALVSAIPRVGEEKKKRIVLEGDVPSPSRPPSGCRFHPRCPFAVDRCRKDEPALANVPGDDTRLAACIRLGEID